VVHPGIIDEGRRDGPIGEVDLGIEDGVEPERGVEGETLVGRQLERCQPGPAARPEGIAQWGSHEAAAEDGAHPVTGGGAVADQPGAVGDDAAQPAGRLVGDPDRRQVVGGQQLREGGRVDVVGLALGIRDGPGAERVRDDHTTGVSPQQLDQGPGVPGGLERHGVVRSERRGEGRELLAHPQAAQLPRAARALHDRGVGEVPAHVEPDIAHGVLHRFLDTSVGDTTPTDPRSKRNRSSRRGRPHILSDSNVH